MEFGEKCYSAMIPLVGMDDALCIADAGYPCYVIGHYCTVPYGFKDLCPSGSIASLISKAEQPTQSPLPQNVAMWIQAPMNAKRSPRGPCMISSNSCRLIFPGPRLSSSSLSMISIIARNLILS